MESVFLQSALAASANYKKEPTKAKRWTCTHRHGEFHTEGSVKCDLKDEDTRTARKLAKKVDQLIAAGETNITKALKEAPETV
jgi:hypothetical protein